MSFYTFLFEQGIISVTIGTISALAITNLTKDVNHLLLREWILKSIKHKSGSISKQNTLLFKLLSSLFEFLFLILFIYMIYHFVLLPLFQKDIQKQERLKERQEHWRQDVLHELQGIESGAVYM
jgi:hypothetical protein